MTDHLQDDLHYGHLGDVRYKRGSESWIAQRKPFLHSTFIPIDNTRADAITSRENQGAARLKAHERELAIRQLADIHPTILPASAVISDLLVEAVHQQEADDYDVLLGDQMAIVNASVLSRRRTSFRKHKDKKAVVLITSGGLRGEELCVFPLQPVRYGFGQDQTDWIEALDVPEIESGRWNGAGDTIRQICRPEHVEKSADMVAVRTSTAIVVMDLVKRDISSNTIPDYDAVSTSSLVVVPNRLARLKSPTGTQVDFVDCTFNPWDHHQIAAVDTLGHWFIWRLSLSTATEVALLASGQMIGDRREDAEDKDDTLSSDGWYRVFWLSSSDEFVLVDRKNVQVSNIRREILIDWRLHSFYPSERIRDARRSPFDLDGIFLVTSRRIILLRLVMEHHAPTVDIIGSWEHHHDRLDRSLTLTFYSAEAGQYIVLRSRLHSLVTQYCLSMSSDVGWPGSGTDPSSLDLRIDGLTGLLFRNCPRNEAQSGRIVGIETSQRVGPATVTQAIFLSRYMHPWTTIYAVVATSPSSSQAHVTNPTWRRIVGKDSAVPAAIVEDDFVLDDGLDSSEDGGPSLSAPGLSTTSSRVVQAEAYTVPSELIYAAIISVPGAERRDRDLAGLLAKLPQLVRNHAPVEPNIFKLLCDMIPRDFQVRDLQKTSTLASSLLEISAISRARHEHNPTVKLLAAPDVLGLGGSAITVDSIDSIHSRLVSTWLRSLPLSAPVKVRLEREKVARQIAASLFLASHGVRGPGEAQDDESLSLDKHPAVPQSEPESVSQEVDGPPPISATPSGNNVNFAVERLRRYAVIKDPPQRTANTISNILGHWKLHGNPAQYDYSRTSAEIEGTSRIAGSSLSAADRERLGKRQARRRQRAEESVARKRARLEAKEVQQREWSIPRPGPAATTMSQTQPSQVTAGSSQAAQSLSHQSSQFAVTGSQIRPGRWGGRQLALRGRPLRPRKAGF